MGAALAVSEAGRHYLDNYDNTWHDFTNWVKDLFT
jgi:hypothetical protein